MKNQKLIAIVLVVLLLAVSLASCFASADGSAASGASSSAPAPTAAPAEDQSADIVVIGAGGAGMTAAIQAVQDGATNVVIVEKMPQTGGNTTRSTGGLNACETSYQAAEGIEDSVGLFVEDTMKGGKELNDRQLVTVMAENSAGAVDWVNEIGGDLSVVGQFAGASVMRIHRPSDTSAVGPMLVKALNAKVEALGIPVLLNTRADEILVDEKGAVSGVKVTGPSGAYTIGCRAVVLATGGFGANNEMVAEYKPELAGFGTTNQAGATGDGIAMAKAAGADFVDMDQIQTHPTVNPDTQTMYTEGVRGNGAILVNKEGKRFVSEMETRDVVSAAILEQTDGVCYMVFDQAVRDSLKAIESYISAGIVFESDTVEGLAEQIGVDPAALRETMDVYAGYAQTGVDGEFGRIDTSMDSDLTTPGFYACLCAPAVHHTMGGVRINASCEVIGAAGSVLPGLFAAGEVTGGVHGANRLGGNAVTDIVVFGRIAGSSAERYLLANGGNTALTIQVEKEETAVPEVEGGYKDGVYTGSGSGNGGALTVTVTVEGGNIVSVKLADHAETDGIWQNAEKGVGNEIIRGQKAEVDVVAGATNTSNGIIEAVKDALKDAK